MAFCPELSPQVNDPLRKRAANAARAIFFEIFESHCIPYKFAKNAARPRSR